MNCTYPMPGSDSRLLFSNRPSTSTSPTKLVRVSTRACRPQLRALRVDVDDYIYECDTWEKKEVAVHSLLRGPEAGALVVSDDLGF